MAAPGAVAARYAGNRGKLGFWPDNNSLRNQTLISPPECIRINW